MRTYALAAIDDHLSKPEALPPTIEDTLKKCERVATESGAWESYRAVGEAFAELRAALNKLAEATQAAAQTKEPKT
jgi:hypothetical protein